MSSVSDNIMKIVQHHGRGYIFTPQDLNLIGSRPAIDTALSRLCAQGKIRRLSRGLYDYPKINPIIGEVFPSLDDVAKVIANNTDSQLQVSGAMATYLLGLTTQVPAQTLYLTSGPSRDIKIGNVVLKFKHTSTKMMAGAGTKAGTILQAIRYLGKPYISQQIIKKIHTQLNDKEKLELKKISRYAPEWMKKNIQLITK